MALLVLLLLSAIGAPAVLALPPQERCTMHCAESEEGGVCCCILDQRERLAERSHDDTPALAQLHQNCASNSAAAPSGGNHVYAHKDLSTAICTASTARDELPAHQAVNPRSLLLCRQSTPRAPPLHA